MKTANGLARETRRDACARNRRPACKVTLGRSCGAGARCSIFEAALRLEFRLATACSPGHDFYEGVRAAVIDKDRDRAGRHAEDATAEVARIEPTAQANAAVRADCTRARHAPS